MKSTKDQLIIEKLKEIIEHFNYRDDSPIWTRKMRQFESELKALESLPDDKVSDSKFEILLTDVMNWQTETFEEATPLSKIRHLQKETEELADDLIKSSIHSPKNVMLRQEYADNFLLLFGSAMSAGFTFEDIMNAMREKLEICKKREWGKPDKDGVVEHIRKD